MLKHTNKMKNIYSIQHIYTETQIAKIQVKIGKMLTFAEIVLESKQTDSHDCVPLHIHTIATTKKKMLQKKRKKHTKNLHNQSTGALTRNVLSIGTNDFQQCVMFVKCAKIFFFFSFLSSNF